MATGIKIVNGSFSISEKKLQTVEEQEKAKRDLHKFLATDQEEDTGTSESVRYNPSFGVLLNRLDLYRGLTIDNILDCMSASLKESLQWYVMLQESRSNLSYGEIIRDIKYYIYRDPDVPNKIKFNIQILMEGDTSYSTLGVYSQKV